MSKDTRLERPYLAPWYKVLKDHGRLILYHGDKAVILEGRAVETLLYALLPLLDGYHTIESIVEELGEQHRPAITYAISTLEGANLICEGPPAGDGYAERDLGREESAEFITSLQQDSADVYGAAELLGQNSVCVLGTGTRATQITSSLRASGFGRVESLSWSSKAPTDEFDIAIAAPTGQELERLDKWNEQALDRGMTWIQSLPFDGQLLIVGPVFIPGVAACHACFKLRRAANVAFTSDYEKLFPHSASPQQPVSIQAMSTGLTTILALRWAVSREHHLPGRLYVLEARTLELESYLLYRVPRCNVCSDVSSSGQPFPWHRKVPDNEKC